MSARRKKNALFYAIALACSLTAIFITYSCSTDENYTDNTLIDSIASSDEFWEFEMSSELLADKFHEYTSTLSEEEYDKLMENLNDDDYMEDFARKANLQDELQQMAKAKEKLIFKIK